MDEQGYLLSGLSRLLLEDLGIELVEGECLGAFCLALSEKLDHEVHRVGEMSGISGRTSVNVFDVETILADHHVADLTEHIQRCRQLPAQHRGRLANKADSDLSTALKTASVRVVRRPPDYTFKRTAVRAYRPDDPVRMQRARADQQHLVEEALRRRAVREDISPLVNYEL